MGKAFDPPIPETLQAWINKQKLFCVASAPLSSTGHVNLSPKSASEFRFLDSSTVCYMDFAGSGSETSAHIMEKDNGRLVFMFMAFEGPPKIVRLHGHGKLVLLEEIFQPKRDDSGIGGRILEVFKDMLGDVTSAEELRAKQPGARSFIVLNVERYSQSCVYAVPYFNYEKPRTVLDNFHQEKGPEGIKQYVQHKNSYSIDKAKSVGQLQAGGYISSVEKKDGYYLAKYESNPNIFIYVLEKVIVILDTLKTKLGFIRKRNMFATFIVFYLVGRKTRIKIE